jgi:hypothetical protein
MGTFTKHARKRRIKSKLLMAEQINQYLIRHINKLTADLKAYEPPTLAQLNQQRMNTIQEAICGASPS